MADALDRSRSQRIRDIKCDIRQRQFVINVPRTANLAVEQLALDYYEPARSNQLVDVEAAEFMRWFDLMGVQRHLKAIGIFSRLKIRDGKTGYLKDIPRTLQYVRQVSAAQTSMAELLDLLETLDLKQRVAALAAG